MLEKFQKYLHVFVLFFFLKRCVSFILSIAEIYIHTQMKTPDIVSTLLFSEHSNQNHPAAMNFSVFRRQVIYLCVISFLFFFSTHFQTINKHLRFFPVLNYGLLHREQSMRAKHREREKQRAKKKTLAHTRNQIQSAEWM